MLPPQHEQAAALDHNQVRIVELEAQVALQKEYIRRLEEATDPGPEPTGFEAWWQETGWSDWAAFGPKVQEYGSNDLIAIGRDILAIGGWNDAPDRVAAELGVLFYLRGKIARAMEAVTNHRLPSEDTLHDIVVYGMMARRIREHGSLT